MARRSTSLSKGSASQKDTPAEIADIVPAKASRRGKRGGEEKAASVPESVPAEPVKARRVRRPRSIELAAETLEASDDHAEEVAAPAQEASPAESPAPVIEPVEAPSESPVSADSAAAPAAQPSAVQWDAASDTVTFDWPAIEQVAAGSGANQAMAKLLLAARAEGAKSRWPF